MPSAGLARRCGRAARARARSGSARRRRARSARASCSVSVPCAQLRAEARVGAQRGRRAREHAEEVRQLAGAGERALEHRQRRLGRGQVVVDLEAAHLGLHCEPPWGEGARGALDSASLPLISVGRGASLATARATASTLRREDGDQDQQQPERERPGDDPRRIARQALLDRARRPAAARGGREWRDLRHLAGAAVDADRAAAVGDDLGLAARRRPRSRSSPRCRASQRLGRPRRASLGRRARTCRLERLVGAPVLDRPAPAARRALLGAGVADEASARAAPRTRGKLSSMPQSSAGRRRGASAFVVVQNPLVPGRVLWHRSGSSSVRLRG